MRLRFAIDHSARELLLRAARTFARDVDVGAFSAALGAASHEPTPAPDVDLLVRTGGEQRLSDVLLWEAAYAELWFTPMLWPDFRENDLARALAEFASRERRYGASAADLGVDAGAAQRSA